MPSCSILFHFLDKNSSNILEIYIRLSFSVILIVIITYSITQWMSLLSYSKTSGQFLWPLFALSYHYIHVIIIRPETVGVCDYRYCESEIRLHVTVAISELLCFYVYCQCVCNFIFVIYVQLKLANVPNRFG